LELIIGGKNVSIMCYANEIVLIAGREQDIQCLLDNYKAGEWCQSCKMCVNEGNTEIIHFWTASSQK
jgi:hypothetical protein